MKLEMQALETIAKTREYLDYVERHIKNVARAWGEVMEAMERSGEYPVWFDDYRYQSLKGEVERHDMSKLSPEEFVQYRLMFYPTAGEKKESARRFDEAWQHHWESNHHHWEKWVGTDYYNPYEPEIHCTHMVIDWLAMSYEFGDTPRKYYEKNKGKIKLPEWAVKYINDLFDDLEANAGEAAVACAESCSRPICSAEWFSGDIKPPSDITHNRVVGILEDCSCALIWWRDNQWEFIGKRQDLPKVKCWTRLPWLNNDHPFSEKEIIRNE